MEKQLEKALSTSVKQSHQNSRGDLVLVQEPYVFPFLLPFPLPEAYHHQELSSLG